MLQAILAAIGAAIIGVAVIHLVLITMAIIVEWFIERKYIITSNPDHIAFTLKDNLESGNYRVVQGIFDKGNSTVKETRVMEAKDLDEDVKKSHDKDTLILYE